MNTIYQWHGFCLVLCFFVYGFIDASYERSLTRIAKDWGAEARAKLEKNVRTGMHQATIGQTRIAQQAASKGQKVLSWASKQVGADTAAGTWLAKRSQNLQTKAQGLRAKEEQLKRGYKTLYPADKDEFGTEN